MPTSKEIKISYFYGGQIAVSVLFRITLTFLVSKHTVFRALGSLKHS